MRTHNLLVVIGIALFVYILSRVGLRSIAEVMLSADPWYLLLLIPLLAANVLTKGLKWKEIIRAHSTDYPILSSCKIFLIGLFTGLVTPARAGDIIRVFYLRKSNNISTAKAVSTVFIDRLLDIITLVVLLGISVAVLGTYISIPLYFSLFTFLFLIAFFVAMKRGLIEKVLKFLFSLFAPEKYRPALREFYHNAKNSDKGLILTAFLLGLVTWGLTIGEGYLIVLSLGLKIPISYLALSIPIITIVEILPISISGMGTREATCIFLFSLIGIKADEAVAFSLLYALLTYWFLGVIGAVLWVRNPVQFK